MPGSGAGVQRPSYQEKTLRDNLKKRTLGWAVIERAWTKQSARINYIREGDANTRFFHLRANGRRRKNYIQRLARGTSSAIEHDDKAQIVHNHFMGVMEGPAPRSLDFNWDSLDLSNSDLSGLDDPISVEEILRALSQLPQDKAQVLTATHASSSGNAGQ